MGRKVILENRCGLKRFFLLLSQATGRHELGRRFLRARKRKGPQLFVAAAAFSCRFSEVLISLVELSSALVRFDRT